MTHIIHTERLRIQAPQPSDIPNVTAILNNEIFAQRTLTIPFPYTEADATYWLGLAEKGLQNGAQYIFVIKLQATDRLIGGIDIRIDRKNDKAEVGYWLDPQYWSNGYMTEALKAIIEFGFTKLGLKKIATFHFMSNPSSGKVMEKAGMQREGILRCNTKKNGQYIDEAVYGIINEKSSG